MELFTNIPLLLDLTFAGTAVHYIRKIRSKSVKLHVAGKQVRLTISQLYIVVAVVFFPILFWSSPVMTLVWLMLTAGSSVFLHALLLDKPLEISINDLV
ncbi:hypothetical protein BABINDRAFT_160158 [Babjeviella inositovora NRRL Y-12698]|uniref:PRA1 family protein n=1 Tax=Babjeviella inositovora NRRL Y-12698 TaxID=984486 RepID=A0A1E3QW84_9ASCO|nr:uncharacterized protein BABINDRAFT_160158 [Babjeviella inositovora NRRL Y-12698]ODQ81936.1 hypothetical protein BABINDRAFT_160158 [Babjeviella inositovora NRRL Y-12698]